MANREVEVVAGNGGLTSSGDGGPALEAGLNLPGSLTFDTDGHLYIAERRRIRRVAPDGTITTYAGDGRAGEDLPKGRARLLRGDGGRAVQAQVEIPTDLSVATEGSLYFVEPLKRQIRRIAADGMIETVAGDWKRAQSCADGTRAYEGEPATEVSLCSPEGLALLSGGDFLFSDNDRIWLVRDGRMTHFAGDGKTAFNPSQLGNGGPAVEASFTLISDLAVDEEGVIYVAEGLDGRVRRITVDGRVSSVAQDVGGGGSMDILLTRSGSLLTYTSTGGLNRVERDGSVTQLMPGFPVTLGTAGVLDDVLFDEYHDMALDGADNLYTSVKIEGFQRVFRMAGPF